MIAKFNKITQKTIFHLLLILQAKKEAEEAEELAEELGVNKNNDMDALSALIQGRQKSREQQSNDFFANLEAKYSQKSTSKKTTTKAKGKKR